jgi:DASS family divalent anion:Na+ symporter
MPESKHQKLARTLVPVVVSLAIWILPIPTGLPPAAKHLLAIFVGTIIGLLLQPLPQGAVVLIGLSLAAITGVLSPGDVLAGYSDSTVWLIVAAFLLARGFTLTGLGRRIAYLLVRLLGGSMLGLGYALTAADAIIAPAMPSNTARGGGVLFPVVRSLSSCLGSEPGPTAHRAGAFLMFNSFQINLVTSALFLTAVAPNVLIAKLAGASLGYSITWILWFRSALVPAVISLAILPLLFYRLLKPELVRSEEAPSLARKELNRLGPVSKGEVCMLLVFLITLLLWATGQWTGLNATVIALTGVAMMVVLGVFSWQDVIGERNAWDALVWFGGLVSLASGLSKLGAIDVLASGVRSALGNVRFWPAALVLLLLVYVYSHYFMASMTAHATAFYVPFCLLATTVGAPVPLIAMVFGFMNSLNAGTTTYGTGPAPIYFGAGYIEQATWWRCGLIASLVNLAIWLLAGGAWWKFLGLW